MSDRDDRGDHCGVCGYQIVCGGCRARALSYTGDIQAGDPGCLFNRHMWNQIEERRQSGSLQDLVAPSTALERDLLPLE